MLFLNTFNKMSFVKVIISSECLKVSLIIIENEIHLTLANFDDLYFIFFPLLYV